MLDKKIESGFWIIAASLIASYFIGYAFSLFF